MTPDFAARDLSGYGLTMLGDAPTTSQNSRRRLAESELLVADEIHAVHEAPPSGHNDRRQLAIPVSGVFEYRVGQRTSWLDPMRLLFVEANEEFHDHHPVAGLGHASVIIAPAAELLDEVSALAMPAYADRVRSCPLRVHMLVQMLKRTDDPLTRDEIGSEILLTSMGESDPVAAWDTRCVRRAKALLHEADGERLTLGAIADQLGVTPIHLTQSFKRSEGVPLYRFQTRLRLSRALAELPNRDDITDLALDLGFSSHSHFTATFRSALGVTPSEFRSGTLPPSEAAARLAA
jgi:AraC-like DNA-binding protein